MYRRELDGQAGGENTAPTSGAIVDLWRHLCASDERPRRQRNPGRRGTDDGRRVDLVSDVFYVFDMGVLALHEVGVNSGLGGGCRVVASVEDYITSQSGGRAPKATVGQLKRHRVWIGTSVHDDVGKRLVLLRPCRSKNANLLRREYNYQPTTKERIP